MSPHGSGSCVDGPRSARTLEGMSRSSRLRSFVRPVGAACWPQALMESADRGLISLSGSDPQDIGRTDGPRQTCSVSWDLAYPHVNQVEPTKLRFARARRVDGICGREPCLSVRVSNPRSRNLVRYQPAVVTAQQSQPMEQRGVGHRKGRAKRKSHEPGGFCVP